MIHETIIDKLAQVDILSVARSLLKTEWKQKGGQWWTISPFKQENTPSFTVHNRKGFYKCHATQKGGRVIGLVMEVAKLDFPQACRWLADFAGIEIPADTPEQAEQEKAIQAQKIRIRQASRQFASSTSTLLNAFLTERHIDEPTAKTFQIGYCPENDPSQFKGRIVFPICDMMGHPIGFGGRTLQPVTTDNPKYINSSTDEVYDKAKALYGWHIARHSVGTAGHALLVEGYMDVIMCHQHGITQAVATCGTALTPQQAKKIGRLIDEVVICRDDDSAGQTATLRDIKVLLAAGLHPAGLRLPDGMDPDDYLNKEGGPALQSLISSAKGWIEYLRDYYLSQHGEINTETGDVSLSVKKSSELLRLVIENLKLIPDALIQQEYAKQAASLLGISMEVMSKEVGINLRSATSAASTNGFRRTWEEYQAICDRFGIENTDFERTDRGFVGIKYIDIDGKPYKVRQGQKSVEAVRSTDAFERPNAVYLPPHLRLKGEDKEFLGWGNLLPLPSAPGLELEEHKKYGYPRPLFIVKDEITASILVQLGLPAVGINNYLGFARNKGHKELHAALVLLIEQYQFRHIVYAVPGEAWTLPDGKEVDMASNAMKYFNALISFNLCLKDMDKMLSYSLTMREGIGEKSADLWIEDLIYRIRQDGKDVRKEFLAFMGTEESPYLSISDITFSREQAIERMLLIENPQAFYDHYADQLPSEFRFKGKLYEVDVKSGAVQLVRGEGDEPDVKEENGAYYSRQRQGGWKQISNFVLECLLEVKADESFNLYKVTSRDTGVSQMTIISDKDFIDRAKFIGCIRRLNALKAYFKGSSQDCIEIQADAIQTAPEAEPLGHTLGLFKPHNFGKERKPFFVQGNGLITLEGEFVPVDEMGLVQYDGYTYFLPAHSNIRTADNHKNKYERQIKFSYRESGIDMQDWLQEFLTVHGDNGHAAFFFFLMSLYRDVIQDKFDERIPHLFLLGPKNAGKGSLQESISALFGQLMVLNLNDDPTSSAYRNHYAQYRNAFAVFNEANPSSVHSWMITGFKGAYDNQTRARMSGPATKEIDYGEVNSAVVIMGQEPSIYNQEAVSTRSIILHCEKEKYSTDEQARHDELKQKEKAGLGHILAGLLPYRGIISDQIAETAKSLQGRLKTEVDRLYGAGASALIDGRLYYNWGVCLAPIWILTSSGEISYVLSNKEILEFAATRIKGQAENMISKGLLEIFFDFITAFYWERSYEIYDHLVWHDKEKGSININLRGLYPKFQSYLSRVAPNLENATSSDLKRRFESHPAYTGYKKSGVWMGYKKDTSGRYVRRKQQKYNSLGEAFWEEGEGIRKPSSGYMFDAEKLGLQLPTPIFPWDDLADHEEHPEPALSPAPSAAVNGSIQDLKVPF